MPQSQIPALTGPHPYAQGQLITQVSTYLPVLLPYANQSVNLLQFTHTVKGSRNR